MATQTLAAGVLCVMLFLTFNQLLALLDSAPAYTLVSVADYDFVRAARESRSWAKDWICCAFVCTWDGGKTAGEAWRESNPVEPDVALPPLGGAPSGLLLFGGGIDAEAQPASATPEQKTDANLEQNLLREIEEAESQLHRAQRELREIESHVARSEEELRKQRQRENELKKTIQQYQGKIQGNNRALEIFRYNLQEKFPREKKRFEDRRETIARKTEAMDRIVTGLIHSSVAWPFERDTYRARRAVLARKMLGWILPAAIGRSGLLFGKFRRSKRNLPGSTATYNWIPPGSNSASGATKPQRERGRENARLKEIARQKIEDQQEIQRGKDRKAALQSLVALLQEKLPLLRQGIDYKSSRNSRECSCGRFGGGVVHEFGTRKHPKFNLKIENAGIDIEAQPGTEVRAAADGWVMFSGDLPGYGSLIMLHHGESISPSILGGVRASGRAATDSPGADRRPGGPPPRIRANRFCISRFVTRRKR
jgi:murein DD-endopeptidase MepM/ murein hydrolase activator NlpD